MKRLLKSIAVANQRRKYGEPFQLFGWKIGKECSARWFQGVGYGYWDGWRHVRLNLKLRKWGFGVDPYNTWGARGFAIGPLMIWRDNVRR